MVKVYTADEVAAGRFPARKDDIREVFDQILAGLTNQRSIVGATLGGSVATDTHTIASDIDGLVVIWDEYLDEGRAQLRLVHQQAATRYVPLNLIEVRRSLCDSPFHSLSVGYFRALRRAASGEGTVGLNPLELINKFPLGLREDAINYVGRKFAKFEDWQCGAVTDPESRRRWLENILNTPIHVARRLLDVRGVTPIRGSSHEIIEAILDLNPVMAAHLVELDRLKQHYIRRLHIHRQLGGDQLDHYRKMLDDIEAASPVAYSICEMAIGILSTL